MILVYYGDAAELCVGLRVVWMGFNSNYGVTDIEI